MKYFFIFNFLFTINIRIKYIESFEEVSIRCYEDILIKQKLTLKQCDFEGLKQVLI